MVRPLSASAAWCDVGSRGSGTACGEVGEPTFSVVGVDAQAASVSPTAARTMMASTRVFM